MSKVKLVAYTKPVDDLNLTPDEFIAFVARVSNPSNQMNKETAPKLLKYLVRNHHWSPFEMAHATMEITTTRDIARQILRHRSFSFQEFSQRYADPTGDLGFVTREARLQDQKNRQNSIETEDEALKARWAQLQSQITDSVTQAYNWAVQHGIAKEQARAVLPEGLTVSRLYMAGSVRSWIHYCALRSSHGTQKEHQQIAVDCWNELVDVYYPSLKDVLTIQE